MGDGSLGDVTGGYYGDPKEMQTIEDTIKRERNFKRKQSNLEASKYKVTGAEKVSAIAGAVGLAATIVNGGDVVMEIGGYSFKGQMDTHWKLKQRVRDEWSYMHEDEAFNYMEQHYEDLYEKTFIEEIGRFFPH